MSSLSGVKLSVSGNCSIGTSASNHQIVGSVVLYHPLNLNNTTITQTGNSGTNTISQPTTFTSAVTFNGGISNALNFNGLVNSGTTNLYSVLNLLSSSLTNANCINFNNGTNSYSVQQIDNLGSYLRIGRTGNSDLVVNSDGSCNINNHLIMPNNGTHSIYFGGNTAGNINGRVFCTTTGMYIDFYNQFLFRYTSAANDGTGMINQLTINSSGITTPGTITSNNISSNTIGISYVTVPISYLSNFSLIGSQQVFYANTTNIVSSSPSFNCATTNVLTLTIGTSNGPTQLQNGVYNLQCSWIYWNSNTTNTMSFQWVSYGISSNSGNGTIINNDILSEYKQEFRTIPTNASSLKTFDYAIKYSSNLTINTSTDFITNTIYFNVMAQYIGATGCQMLNSSSGGIIGTKFVFTRIA